MSNHSQPIPTRSSAAGHGSHAPRRPHSMTISPMRARPPAQRPGRSDQAHGERDASSMPSTPPARATPCRAARAGLYQTAATPPNARRPSLRYKSAAATAAAAAAIAPTVPPDNHAEEPDAWHMADPSTDSAGEQAQHRAQQQHYTSPQQQHYTSPQQQHYTSPQQPHYTSPQQQNYTSPAAAPPAAKREATLTSVSRLRNNVEATLEHLQLRSGAPDRTERASMPAHASTTPEDDTPTARLRRDVDLALRRLRGLASDTLSDNDNWRGTSARLRPAAGTAPGASAALQDGRGVYGAAEQAQAVDVDALEHNGCTDGVLEEESFLPGMPAAVRTSSCEAGTATATHDDEATRAGVGVMDAAWRPTEQSVDAHPAPGMHAQHQHLHQQHASMQHAQAWPMEEVPDVSVSGQTQEEAQLGTDMVAEAQPYDDVVASQQLQGFWNEAPQSTQAAEQPQGFWDEPVQSTQAQQQQQQQEEPGFWDEPARTMQAVQQQGFWDEPAQTTQAAQQQTFWGQPSQGMQPDGMGMAESSPEAGASASGQGMGGAVPGAYGNDGQDDNREIVQIVWDDGGRDVRVAGDFNAWGEPIPLQRTGHGARRQAALRLLPGRYQYKFIVDGEWRCNADAPQESDPAGNVNNVLSVHGSTQQVQTPRTDTELEPQPDDGFQPVAIVWQGGGSSVEIVGDWDEWYERHPLHPNASGAMHAGVLHVPRGRPYEIRAIVDGEWRHDPHLLTVSDMHATNETEPAGAHAAGAPHAVPDAHAQAEMTAHAQAASPTAAHAQAAAPAPAGPSSTVPQAHYTQPAAAASASPRPPPRTPAAAVGVRAAQVQAQEKAGVDPTQMRIRAQPGAYSAASANPADAGVQATSHAPVDSVPDTSSAEVQEPSSYMPAGTRYEAVSSAVTGQQEEEEPRASPRYRRAGPMSIRALKERITATPLSELAASTASRYLDNSDDEHVQPVAQQAGAMYDHHDVKDAVREAVREAVPEAVPEAASTTYDEWGGRWDEGLDEGAEARRWDDGLDEDAESETDALLYQVVKDLEDVDTMLSQVAALDTACAAVSDRDALNDAYAPEELGAAPPSMPFDSDFGAGVEAVVPEGSADALHPDVRPPWEANAGDVRQGKLREVLATLLPPLMAAVDEYMEDAQGVEGGSSLEEALDIAGEIVMTHGKEVAPKLREHVDEARFLSQRVGSGINAAESRRRWAEAYDSAASVKEAEGSLPVRLSHALNNDLANFWEGDTENWPEAWLRKQQRAAQLRAGLFQAQSIPNAADAAMMHKLAHTPLPAITESYPFLLAYEWTAPGTEQRGDLVFCSADKQLLAVEVGHIEPGQASELVVQCMEFGERLREVYQDAKSISTAIYTQTGLQMVEDNYVSESSESDHVE